MCLMPLIRWQTAALRARVETRPGHWDEILRLEEENAALRREVDSLRPQLSLHAGVATERKSDGARVAIMIILKVRGIYARTG